jgi:chemotaxis protein histidine kinase CheA
VTGEAPVVAGATIMGDGRVVLILDVPALFEGRRHALTGGRGEPGTAAVAEGRPR